MSAMVTLRDGLLLGEGGVISLVGAGGKTSLMFGLARELTSAGETVLTTTTTKIHAPSPEQAGTVFIAETADGLLQRIREERGRLRHVTAAAGSLPDQGKLTGLAPEVIRDIWRSRRFRWILVEADGAAGRPLKAPAEHEPVIPACTSLCVGMIGLSGVGRPADPVRVFRLEQFHRLSGLIAGATITPAAVADVLVHARGVFKNTPDDALRIAFCNQADSPRRLAAGRQIAHALTQKKHSGINRVVIGRTLFDPPITEVHDLIPTTRK
ncbi:MAG: selenium cofactor biosynthesis protein YqeC [Desulfobacterales bacterium]|nr:selenium cofactor biosynthesis protein YqeC [Desulfobacterales bacterium]